MKRSKTSYTRWLRQEKKSGNTCTVYLLTNTETLKVYVGQTWLPLHLRMGKEGSNYRNSLYLFYAIKKHGADKFRYEILAQCSDQGVADYLEEHFINQYDSRNPDIGYNLKHGGSAGKHSYETRLKISESLKSKVWSPQALLGRSVAGRLWKGRKRGPMTDEHKALVIQTLKPGSFEGHHHSEEAKAKIGEASKGHSVSEEHRQAISQAHKMEDTREQNIAQAYRAGKTIAEIEITFQTGRSSIYRILKRNNIARDSSRNTWKGKTHSEETKQKMAEARKQYWESK